MHARHDVLYAITSTNDVDDNDNNYPKLEIHDNATTLMVEILVETIVVKNSEYELNNKPNVFPSCDKID